VITLQTAWPRHLWWADVDSRLKNKPKPTQSWLFDFTKSTVGSLGCVLEPTVGSLDTALILFAFCGMQNAEKSKVEFAESSASEIRQNTPFQIFAFRKVHLPVLRYTAIGYCKYSIGPIGPSARKGTITAIAAQQACCSQQQQQWRRWRCKQRSYCSWVDRHCPLTSKK